MSPLLTVLLLLLTGLLAGILAGLFGVGGGIIIVPALVYILGFSMQKATGTSLAVLLPPVGIAAVIYYYNQGNVDIKAAAYIAVALLVGALLGAKIAHLMSGPMLRLAFGLFVTAIGFYLIYGAAQRLGWLK
jgi:hypothetical protein